MSDKMSDLFKMDMLHARLSGEAEEREKERERKAMDIDKIARDLNAITRATEELRRENDEFRRYLERAGWGPCNAPACNCKGWHHLRPARYEQEMIDEATSDIQTERNAIRIERDQLRAENEELKRDKDHAGDCTIYSALINGRPTDGICTCGYGWSLVRSGDWSQMYSAERVNAAREQG